MSIWIPFFDVLWQLRDAFPRKQTFLFFSLAVVGVCVRADTRGVTSFVRSLALREASYHGFLRLFHCSSLDPGRLFDKWTAVVFKIFAKNIVNVNGRMILAADGLKIAKEGRRMPGVRSLHQESSNNTKPTWIMGHYFQVISVIVEGLGRSFAVPLSARIHDGLRCSNRESKTLVEKLYLELLWLPIPQPFILVADSYYAAKVCVDLLSSFKHHLVTQVRMNTVGREEPIQVKGKRGRNPKYGKHVKLQPLFEDEMQAVAATIYGKKEVAIKFWCRDLLWTAHRGKVRFVGTILPDGRRAILMTTDLTLEPKEIIEIYALRMKIEQSFKVSTRQLGSFAYHFWCKSMDKIKSRSNGQYLHKKSIEYREKMIQKFESCERFVFSGCVAQGILQYLASCYPGLVWASFNSWYRSQLTTASPTEEIVQSALKTRLFELFTCKQISPEITKFIAEKTGKNRLSESFLSTG